MRKFLSPREVRNRSGPSLKAAALAAVVLLAATGVGEAHSGEPSTSSVADLSLEDLVNVTITSVSKKEEKLNDAAAAVFVLNGDDLRRSGATTVADALRLVPGLQVASIDSSTWAVSARGFNSQFANKLLVMIDGRTVYSPLFSGVYWDAQQVFLEDVERIEVIRGPGATVWGANAVNGVISIITKSARDSQGGLLYGGGGHVREALGGARYGGKIGQKTFYRVFGNYQLNDDFRQANGQPANDSWDLARGGFRVDHYTDKDGQLTWLANAYTGNLTDRTGDLSGFSTLGRWTKRFSERSSYEVQAFVDHTHRDDALADVSLDTVDLTFQHTWGLGKRNDVLWGLGYRYIDARLNAANNPAVTILDDDVALNLFSAFLQDELKIIPDRLALTLGTKIEHNDFTGVEFQPNARLMYKPAENQTVWLAASRAVRTPSDSEGKKIITFATGAPVFGPGGGLYVPTVVGDPDVASEVLWAYEIGYRVQPGHRVNVDVATFYNDYDRLIVRQPSGFIPGVPVGVMVLSPVNALKGHSYGLETALTFDATESWRLSGNYSYLKLDFEGDTSTDATYAESNAPTHQVVLRSAYDFAGHASFDAQVRYVDDAFNVPSYVTADLRFAYRPTDSLELSLVGQNLLEDQHPEQASQLGLPTTEVPRAFYGKIVWRF